MTVRFTPEKAKEITQVGVKAPQLLKVRAKYLSKELIEEIFWIGVV